MTNLKKKPSPNIGKLCYFWDGNPRRKEIGVLKKIYANLEVNGFPYINQNGAYYTNCKPLTRKKLEKFLGKLKPNW